jgi:methylated-DNA-[protein]-cysteine S-methyltransferase
MINSSQLARTAPNQQYSPASELTREYFANVYFSMNVQWQGQKIQTIELGPGKHRPYTGQGATLYSEKIASAMKLYQNRQKVLWLDPPLDWSLITSPFQKQVLLTLMKNIPFGRTTSYGQLARLSGRAGAARAVGWAMSRNPWPVIVPCHRVLTGKGGIGGFSSGPALKKTLLTLEGCFNTTIII